MQAVCDNPIQSLLMLLFKFFNEWRWPLCFMSVRNWRNLYSKRRQPERINRAFRYNCSFAGILRRSLNAALKALRNNKLIKKIFSKRIAAKHSRYIHTVFLHARMKLEKIKPVVSARKYLITLVNLPRSAEAAEKCLASASLHGEEHNVEIFPAIDRYQSESFFTEHDLIWETPNRTLYDKAAMGCFASHFSLWLKCIELDEPIIVMEHDVVFISKIPPLKFRHIAALSCNDSSTHFYHRFSKNKKQRLTPQCIESYHPAEHLPGTGAYAITPAGARILVEEAHCRYAAPTDVFIRKMLVHIVSYYPMPFDHTDSFSSIQYPPDPPDLGSNYKAAEEVWSEYNFND